MSRNPLRKDKTCLNCNHVVDNIFCPNCGQENIEPRKTFHHLFIHFIEDLTHYENSFWKTIRNLILKPASLTKEYLSGKRMSYLAPIRLYIFISFVTFLTIALLPSEDKDEVVKFEDKKTNKSVANKTKNYYLKNEMSDEQIIDKLLEKEELSKKEKDSIKDIFLKAKKDSKFMNFGYKSIEEMDSIKKVNPNQINDFEYWLNSKSIKVNEKFTAEEINDKLSESFIHNIPKALFIYMPLFALVLLIFQNKKKWYYFDHGIFTLHYFSFLLLGLLLLSILNFIFSLIDSSIITVLQVIINFICLTYMFYYFFPAHHRFYGESRVVSFFKGITIFIINMFFVLIIAVLLVIYSFISLI